MPMPPVPPHIAQAAQLLSDYFDQQHVENWRLGKVQSTAPAPLDSDMTMPAPLDELPELESDQGELDRLALVVNRR